MTGKFVILLLCCLLVLCGSVFGKRRIVLNQRNPVKGGGDLVRFVDGKTDETYFTFESAYPTTEPPRDGALKGLKMFLVPAVKREPELLNLLAPIIKRFRDKCYMEDYYGNVVGLDRTAMSGYQYVVESGILELEALKSKSGFFSKTLARPSYFLWNRDRLFNGTLHVAGKSDISLGKINVRTLQMSKNVETGMWYVRVPVKLTDEIRSKLLDPKYFQYKLIFTSRGLSNHYKLMGKSIDSIDFSPNPNEDAKDARKEEVPMSDALVSWNSKINPLNLTNIETYDYEVVHNRGISIDFHFKLPDNFLRSAQKVLKNGNRHDLFMNTLKIKPEIVAGASSKYTGFASSINFNFARISFILMNAEMTRTGAAVLSLKFNITTAPNHSPPIRPLAPILLQYGGMESNVKYRIRDSILPEWTKEEGVYMMVSIDKYTNSIKYSIVKPTGIHRFNSDFENEYPRWSEREDTAKPMKPEIIDITDRE